MRRHREQRLHRGAEPGEGLFSYSNLESRTVAFARVGLVVSQMGQCVAPCEGYLRPAIPARPRLRLGYCQMLHADSATPRVWGTQGPHRTADTLLARASAGAGACAGAHQTLKCPERPVLDPFSHSSFLFSTSGLTLSSLVRLFTSASVPFPILCRPLHIQREQSQWHPELSSSEVVVSLTARPLDSRGIRGWITCHHRDHNKSL